MIDLSQSTLVYLLLGAVILGVLHGIVYDAIRFLKLMMGVEYGNARSGKRMGKCKGVILNTVTFLFDVIFWVSFAMSSVLLTYNVSGGIFRGLVYVGMLCGGAAYYYTLGRLVLKFNVWLTGKLKKLIKAVIHLALVPVKAIISLIIKLYHLTIGKVIGKIKAVVKERRKRRRAVLTESNVPSLPEYSKEENDKDVTKYRYKREGRISFAGRRIEQRPH